jgi:glycosyltransferase involved in cell wall biosynthesis
LVFHLPDELDLLTRTLRQIGVARIEFHHLLGLSPTVLDLPHLLGLPYEVHIHDYAWICPRIVLVTEAGRYCGEPDLDGCDACIARDGSELEEAIATGPLRERSRRLFAGASRIVAATDDTRRRLARYFPASVVHVVPWEAPIPPIAPVRDPIEGRRIRVALIGAFDTHKGLWVLEACARDAARRDLPLEFVLIGHSVADARLFQTGRVFVTGRFEEAEIADLLARERCDVAFFPSVCPETWSYSLSHAMRAGLPILGFDLGAIGSRLRDRPWARVVSPDTTAPELNQQLWELASEPGHRHNAARAADNPSFTDSKGYEKLITDVDRAAPAEGTSNVTSSVQILNLGEGLYSFAVREGGPSAAPDANISLPALQISTGPATKRGGQLTLLAAPSMPSPWLTRAGDVVIAQVAGGPCPVVLTSLGLANSPPLDVEVRRLDEAGAAKPPQPAIEPARIVAGSNREPAPAVAAVPVPAAPASTDSSVRLQVLTHIQNRGDVPFIGGNWAGFVGQSVWMEAFAVAPLDRLGPNAIEYKGRTAGGFETPWLSGGVWCGTRGMGVPLVEFAVRLAPEFAAAYECEYRGAFFSGSIVGPLKDGMPCRSRVPNDPLEAIQLRVGDRRLVRR